MEHLPIPTAHAKNLAYGCTTIGRTERRRNPEGRQTANLLGCAGPLRRRDPPRRSASEAGSAASRARRRRRFRPRGTSRTGISPSQSGVALRLPPHSKTARPSRLNGPFSPAPGPSATAAPGKANQAGSNQIKPNQTDQTKKVKAGDRRRFGCCPRRLQGNPPASIFMGCWKNPSALSGHRWKSSPCWRWSSAGS